MFIKPSMIELEKNTNAILSWMDNGRVLKNQKVGF